jgi:hypothetical protein
LIWHKEDEDKKLPFSFQCKRYDVPEQALSERARYLVAKHLRDMDMEALHL